VGDRRPYANETGFAETASGSSGRNQSVSRVSHISTTELPGDGQHSIEKWLSNSDSAEELRGGVCNPRHMAVRGWTVLAQHRGYTWGRPTMDHWEATKNLVVEQLSFAKNMSDL
jgi:hypothetical protein